MKQLGVVILSQYFHPEVGATQTRARELARAFLRAGHRVTVVCEFPNHPQGIIPDSYRGKCFETDELDGFQVLRVRVAASPVKTFRTRLLFYLSYMVMSTLAAFRPLGRVDLVLATSPPLPVAMAGWCFAALRRARFVMDVRDLWPDAAVALGELSRPSLVRAASIAERFLYRRALLITAVTRGFVKAIAAKGIAPEKIHWAPNGTMADLYGPAAPDRELRSELGLGDRFTVLFAGLFGIAQGMDFLLDLAASYSEDENIAFLFVGDGPLKDRLEARVRDEKLTNVLFHPQVKPGEAAAFLNLADLLLVPLKADPVFADFVPSKLYDCLACRPPVLVSVPGSENGPGEAEQLVREAGGGVAAAPGEMDSFRAAIDLIRGDPASAREMGEAGQRFVLPRFSRPKVMDRLVDEVIDRMR